MMVIQFGGAMETGRRRRVVNSSESFLELQVLYFKSIVA